MSLAHYQPAAIGIDVDFSPDYIDGRLQFIEPKEDPRFIADCGNVFGPDGKKISVFLGVSRTTGYPPDQWLVLPMFQPMAAGLWLPSEVERTPVSLIRSSDPEQRRLGRTMGEALASAYITGHSTPPKKNFLLRSSIEELGDDVSVEESWVDYSVLNRLRDQRIRISQFAFTNNNALQSEVRLRSEEIKGKMLLLGDVSHSPAGSEGNRDSFSNPVPGELIPGVLVHAAAAYTAAANPLRVFPKYIEYPIDFILAFAILSISTVIKLGYEGRFHERRLVTLLTVSCVTLVVFIGFLVNRTHVFWEGFLLVAILIAIHPFCHRTMDLQWERLSAWLKPSAQEAE